MHTRLSFYTATSAWLFLTTAAFAQDITVTVTDQDPGIPLEDALIEVSDSGKIYRTDTEGKVIIPAAGNDEKKQRRRISSGTG
ncbi:MAG: hypothetical protein M0P01_04015 [Treponema sp.]|nr:hypothetical protein [Treponema sp.]